MILIQLKTPPMSLFIKGEYGDWVKKHGPDLAPYAPVMNWKGKKAIIPLKDNTNIAYVRESSDEEAAAMMTPPDPRKIEQPGMIIGRSRQGHPGGN